MDKSAGKVLRHGTLFDVAQAVPGLKKRGVTTLYVFGAMERDNGWPEVSCNGCCCMLIPSFLIKGFPPCDMIRQC